VRSPKTARRKHWRARYQEARLVAAQAHGTVTARFGATLYDVNVASDRLGSI